MANYPNFKPYDPQIPRPSVRLPRAPEIYSNVEQYEQLMNIYIEAEEIASQENQENRLYLCQDCNWADQTTVTIQMQKKLLTSIEANDAIVITNKVEKHMGFVSSRKDSSLCLKFTTPSPLFSVTDLYISIFPSSSTFRRERQAIAHFAHSSSPIVKTILGQTDPTDPSNLLYPSFDKMPKILNPDPQYFHALNNYQILAIYKALQRRFSMIQGPPGTGKTTVIAAIALNFVRQGKTPVLVCAQSNVAANQAATRIAQTGVNVTRVFGSMQEDIPADVMHLSASEKAKQAFEFQFDQNESSISSIFKMESVVIDHSDVVVTTCSGSAGPQFRNIKSFNSLIIDEATQCLDPDILIPFAQLSIKGQMVIVGDHKQLGPFLFSQKCVEAGYGISLIERLSNVNKGFLSAIVIQYRMHPSLSEWPNNYFYNGFLKDQFDGKALAKVPWPNPEVPIVFWDINSVESFDGQTYSNNVEAEAVASFIDLLAKYGVKSSGIGIITPYSGQTLLLQGGLERLCQIADREYLSGIEIKSVDGFQGREKEYIVFSCVRSNREREIGFLADEHRICVSLTRARFGEFFVGNSRTLASNELWNSFLTFIFSKRCLVRGKSLETVRIVKEENSQPKERVARSQTPNYDNRINQNPRFPKEEENRSTSNAIRTEKKTQKAIILSQARSQGSA